MFPFDTIGLVIQNLLNMEYRRITHKKCKWKTAFRPKWATTITFKLGQSQFSKKILNSGVNEKYTTHLHFVPVSCFTFKKSS